MRATGASPGYCNRFNVFRIGDIVASTDDKGHFLFSPSSSENTGSTIQAAGVEWLPPSQLPVRYVDQLSEALFASQTILRGLKPLAVLWVDSPEGEADPMIEAVQTVASFTQLEAASPTGKGKNDATAPKMIVEALDAAEKERRRASRPPVRIQAAYPSYA